jgi:hypothetical protein
MGLSPYSERVMVIQDSPGLDYRCTMTVVTQLDNPQQPIFAKLTEGSNDGLNFGLLTLELIAEGVLKPGDTLCLGTHHLTYWAHLLIENAQILNGSQIMPAFTMPKTLLKFSRMLALR